MEGMRLIRKITWTGNSNTIIIPKKVCEELDIRRGDYISITINKKLEA